MPAIRLYNFAKKRNSTKQPTGGTVLNGEFRGPLDVLHPVIRLTDPAQDDQLIVTGYNYAYIGATGRYYWIRNITAIGGRLFDVQMDVDVLATYRGSIGASTQYVLRAASDRDTTIIDTYYPSTTGLTQVTTDISRDILWYTEHGSSMEYGTYIIGIINGDSTAYGSVSYYAMLPPTFNYLKSRLLTTVSWSNMDFTTGEISEALYKSLVNPMQYISSCVWYPFYPESVGDGTKSIRIGPWVITMLGDSNIVYPLSGSAEANGYIDVTMPNHPRVTLSGPYLNAPPFTSRRLELEPFGVVDIDCRPLAYSNAQIRIMWHIDLCTGEARLRVSKVIDNTTLAWSTAQLGVPVTLSAATQNIVGGITSIAQGALGFAGGILNKSLSGAVLGAAAGIGNAAESMAPVVSSTGSTGSRLPFSVYGGRIISEFADLVAPDNDRFGSPLCSRRSINELSGYILCADAHIEISRAMSEELDSIGNYLNTGFYFE